LRVLPVLIVLLALSLAGQAVAAEPYGELTLVQERRAGFLEEVDRPSERVTIERGEERLVGARGTGIFEGDVIVTGRASCVVTTPDGWSVAIAEDSRLEVRTTWRQHVGTALYRVRAAFGVQVEGVEVLVEGTEFVVTYDGQRGEVAVLEGAVRVRGEEGEALLGPGERVVFEGGGAMGAVVGVGSSRRRALARTARGLTLANGGSLSRADRLRIGVGFGFGAAQERAWGQAQLRARLRVAGPVWLAAGGGLMARRLGPEDPRLTLAFPTALGLRWVADVKALTLSLGASFDLLLGERCVEPIACERVLSAEPGGTLDLGVGVMIGRRLALTLEGRIGGSVRRVYGDAFRLEPVVVPSQRADLLLYVEVRL